MLRAAIVIASLFVCTTAWPQGARDHIHVVGSSTVYPFITVAAERFGRSTPFRTPTVESTGTGAGFRLFCGGVGVDSPDIVSSSRRMKPSEAAACARNGVSGIAEVRIGYDGIVLAQRGDEDRMHLTLREVFLALARDVPSGDGHALQPNPYRRWSDIHPRLPDARIEVYGPPPTSGTRDELVEQALERGCHAFSWLAAMHERDAERHRQICQTVREDGAYIEAGENDNVIIQKLLSGANAVGIFGYNFLDQNAGRVQAVAVDGIVPGYDSIAERRYPITRPLYVYVKTSHVGVIAGLDTFLEELTSERALGEDGYLADRGLVAMSDAERQRELAKVHGFLDAPMARH